MFLAFTNLGDAQGITLLPEGLKQDVKKAASEHPKGKIHVYAHLMATLAKLVKPSEALHPKLSRQIKNTLHEAGVSEWCARRYIDRSVGALKRNPDILQAAQSPEGAKAVLELFDALGIKTEKAIFELGFKGPDPLDQIANRLAGLTPEQRAEVVFDRLHAARQRRAAKAKKSPAQQLEMARGYNETAADKIHMLKVARNKRAEARLDGSDLGAVASEANLLDNEVIEVRIEIRRRPASFASPGTGAALDRREDD